MKIEHHQVIYQHELTHWWYRVRREMVHDIILSVYPNRNDLLILDIGSGAGALTKELERYGRCIGLDMSEDAVAFGKARGVREVQLGSATETGLPSDTYDIVTCLDVLEHLPDDLLGMTELRRVLKPGGIGIIFVPAFMFLWGINDEQSHHFRRYRLTEIEEKLLSVGLTINRKTYFNTLLFPLIALTRALFKLFSIRVSSEVTMGNRMLDNIFYHIFSFERTLRRFTNFPFGVSAMLIVTKKD